ncbi:MAG TPA: hypothetical protein VFB59_05320 [Candidatus Saccharimonadales bacterium]|nr:hypothetical protein [Candidatus Saccharimonadales bacterium]
MSSSEPDIFDKYDPSIASLARYATFYWPGGDPETGVNFETFALRELPSPSEAATEAARVRRAILGAYIGSAALGRVPPEMHELWRITEETLTFPAAIVQLSEACKKFELPLVVCAMSDITDPKLDKRIMHMWYPSTIHPGPVLKELQRVVHDVS